MFENVVSYKSIEAPANALVLMSCFYNTNWFSTYRLGKYYYDFLVLKVYRDMTSQLLYSVVKKVMLEFNEWVIHAVGSAMYGMLT